MIAAPEPGGSGEPLTDLKFLYLVKGGYGQRGLRIAGEDYGELIK